MVELLKQGAQRDRRPERAVRHDWYRVITRAVALPVQDNGAGITLVALLAALPRPYTITGPASLLSPFSLRCPVRIGTAVLGKRNVSG